MTAMKGALFLDKQLILLESTRLWRVCQEVASV
jgi:hypothetical protein